MHNSLTITSVSEIFFTNLHIIEHTNLTTSHKMLLSLSTEQIANLYKITI